MKEDGFVLLEFEYDRAVVGNSDAPFEMVFTNHEMRASLRNYLQALTYGSQTRSIIGFARNLGFDLPQNLVLPPDVAYSSHPLPSA